MTAILLLYTLCQISSASSSLVINGTGLGTTVGDVTVMVGDVDCEVTAVQDELVECDIGPMPAGTHEIYVDVSGKGT